MPRIYFDNSATTPVLPEVFEAMRPYFDERFGNASSIHRNGQQTRAAVEQARESMAALLACRPPEVVFTSGGTEADNLAIFGVADAGDHVITSTVEHHAVLNACKHLEAEGADVTYLPVDGRGLVDPADVRRALRSTTKLITVMMANNETGVLQPVEEIGKIAAESEVYFHTGAAGCCEYRLRLAVDLRAQDSCAARCRRPLRAQGNCPRADALWRPSRTIPAGRHGKCSGNRGARQGGGTCASQAGE
jgi:cysteine desulfurase